MKTNLLTIQMTFYLISMVDPWFPIFYEQGKEEKPLDETKMAKLLHRFDNMLTGLTEWSKRVYTPSLCQYLVQEKEKFSCLNLGTTG